MAAPIVIAATTKHTATLIFLHGLGDTGQGWASAMGSMRPAHVKVICPTAPTMPVTLNAGFRMPSWFDLRTLDASGPEDEEGIKLAAKQIHTMIDGEIKGGIPAERIIVGGFSQGGALALYSALTLTQQLAGVITLSGWIPLHKSFPAAMLATDKLAVSRDILFTRGLYDLGKRGFDHIVLQCHGDCDPVVPFKWGQMTASVLKTLLKGHEFKSYRGLMHTSSDDELRDVKQFIERHLPPQ